MTYYINLKPASFALARHHLGKAYPQMTQEALTRLLYAGAKGNPQARLKCAFAGVSAT